MCEGLLYAKQLKLSNYQLTKIITHMEGRGLLQHFLPPEEKSFMMNHNDI